MFDSLQDIENFLEQHPNPVLEDFERWADRKETWDDILSSSVFSYGRQISVFQKIAGIKDEHQVLINSEVENLQCKSAIIINSTVTGFICADDIYIYGGTVSAAVFSVKNLVIGASCKVQDGNIINTCFLPPIKERTLRELEEKLTGYMRQVSANIPTIDVRFAEPICSKSVIKTDTFYDITNEYPQCSTALAQKICQLINDGEPLSARGLQLVISILRSVRDKVEDKDAIDKLLNELAPEAPQQLAIQVTPDTTLREHIACGKKVSENAPVITRGKTIGSGNWTKLLISMYDPGFQSQDKETLFRLVNVDADFARKVNDILQIEKNYLED